MIFSYFYLASILSNIKRTSNVQLMVYFDIFDRFMLIESDD